MKKKLIKVDMKKKLFGNYALQGKHKTTNAPDYMLKDHSGSSYAELFEYTVNPKKDAFILDIGGRENKFVKALHERGFTNAFGIDVGRSILDDENGVQVDIMDVPERAQFDYIHFTGLLDYFGGGQFDNSVELVDLANKLDKLLCPGGTIVFNLLEENIEKFIPLLTAKGYMYTDSTYSTLTKPN